VSRPRRRSFRRVVHEPFQYALFSLKIQRTKNSCICIYPVVSRSSLPSLPCLCGSIRRTSRALTQVYEQALRPFGMRATQFTILQVLARTGELSQGQLGEILAMDLTTLTRTLDAMRRQGWVAERRGEDRRWRFWSLARAGQAQLELAEPAWREVQVRLRHRLGEKKWNTLLQLANEVAGTLEK